MIINLKRLLYLVVVCTSKRLRMKSISKSNTIGSIADIMRYTPEKNSKHIPSCDCRRFLS